MTVGDIQKTVATALGGAVVTTTVKKAASATASSCATRAIFATIRVQSHPRCWCQR